MQMSPRPDLGWPDYTPRLLGAPLEAKRLRLIAASVISIASGLIGLLGFMTAGGKMDNTIPQAGTRYEQTGNAQESGRGNASNRFQAMR